MAKQSPFYLNVPAHEGAEFVFADKKTNPVNEFRVVLRKMSRVDALAYLERAEEYIERYITGEGEPGKPGYVAPRNLPPTGGSTVTVTRPTCRVLACIEFAQIQPEEERYTFEELAAMAAVPKIAAQMFRAMHAIQDIEEEEDDSPLEGSGEATPASSSEGSEATQN